MSTWPLTFETVYNKRLPFSSGAKKFGAQQTEFGVFTLRHQRGANSREMRDKNSFRPPSRGGSGRNLMKYILSEHAACQINFFPLFFSLSNGVLWIALSNQCFMGDTPFLTVLSSIEQKFPCSYHYGSGARD